MRCLGLEYWIVALTSPFALHAISALWSTFIALQSKGQSLVPRKVQEGDQVEVSKRKCTREKVLPWLEEDSER